MTNTNLLKSKMVAAGDDDYVAVLARILEISRPTASKKLNGQAPFSQEDIMIIIARYDLDSNEVMEVFFK